MGDPIGRTTVRFVRVLGENEKLIWSLFGSEIPVVVLLTGLDQVSLLFKGFAWYGTLEGDKIFVWNSITDSQGISFHHMDWFPRIEEFPST